MKKSLFLIFFVLSQLLMAQDSFLVKSKGFYDFNLGYDVLVKPDGNMLFLVLTLDDIGQQCASDIHEISPQGEMIKRVTLADTSIWLESYYYMSIVSDTIYVIGFGETNDSLQQPLVLLRKLDMQLNLLESIKMNIEIDGFIQFSMGGTFKFSGENFEGFGSASVGGFTARPFWVEISKSGELIGSIVDTESGYMQIPQDFLFRPDDEGFYTFTWLSGLTGYETNTYMYAYDNDLEIESIVPLPEPITMYVDVLPITDTSYYMAAHYKEIEPFFGRSRMGVWEMTTDGTVVNEFLYGVSNDTAQHICYFHSIDTCSDGSLIVCGINNLEVQLSHQNEPASILLFKLTKDLDVVWQRYIGANDGKYDAFAMRTTPEDDIVILGIFSDVPVVSIHFNEPMFIRTNSDGLITGLNEPNSHFYSKEAIVYPNPARNFVTIDFSMAYPNALFTLRDIAGNVVLETRLSSNRQEVDISKLVPGTYVYTIYNRKGLNESGKLVVE